MNESKQNIYGDDPPTTWAKARTYGIGGSDAPAVLGLNPWCSPYTLWCRKSGLIKPIEQTERMAWGHRLEDVIAAYYAEQTGLSVHRAENLQAEFDAAKIEIYQDGHLYRSVERPWQLASVDRIVACDKRGIGVLEIKNVGERSREKWSDGVPEYVRAQNLHYQQVLGLEWGAVAVLFGGNDPGFMDVVARPGEAEAMLAAEMAFYESLEGGDPPPPDGSQSTRDAVKELYPDARTPAIALSDDALLWDREFVEHKRIAKIHAEKAKGLETLIRAEIGDAAGGLLASGVRWKTTTVAPVEVKAQTRRGYRRYTRSEPKKR